MVWRITTFDNGDFRFSSCASIHSFIICLGLVRTRASLTCSGKVLRITDNMKKGLRILSIRSGWIWADAICINQKGYSGTEFTSPAQLRSFGWPLSAPTGWWPSGSLRSGRGHFFRESRRVSLGSQSNAIRSSRYMHQESLHGCHCQFSPRRRHHCNHPWSSNSFILRPVEGKASYRLIGEAYVYGIMDGELMQLDAKTNRLRVKGKILTDFRIIWQACYL